MDDNLHLLIDELQSEHDQLSKELKLHTTHWDFEYAAHTATRLRAVKRKLQVLNNFAYPKYHLIGPLRRKLALLRIKKKTPNKSRTKLLDEITSVQQQISELESWQHPREDTDHLLSAIEKLRNNKINRFVLQSTDTSFAIMATYHNEKIDLDITVDYPDKINKVFSSTVLQDIKNLGFRTLKNEMTLRNNNLKGASDTHILEILSCLFFDILKHYVTFHRSSW